MDEYYLALTPTPVDRQEHWPRSGRHQTAGLQRKDKTIASPAWSYGSPTLDKNAQAGVAAGGKVKQPKTEIPEMLWYAVILDTEGNELGVADTWRDKGAAGRPPSLRFLLVTAALGFDRRHRGLRGRCRSRHSGAAWIRSCPPAQSSGPRGVLGGLTT